MITDIRLQQFRSYADASFECSPSVNIIVGPNASGKTNLLEAVLMVARGASYRARDNELIMFQHDWARLDAHTASGLRTVKLTDQPTGGKSYELDGRTYKRLSLQHSLPIVLFEPNHLTLLHGSPEQRRAYLDDLLLQTNGNHATLLRNYKRLVAQRNALLKRPKKPTNEELFPWNLRLSELGAVLSRRRAELVSDIATQLATTYQALAQAQTKVAIEYQPFFRADSYETELLQTLEASLSLDIARGFTASGPHREDFVVTFEGHPADETASRGETRTLILALKVLELEILTTVREAAPLLLLDDVFSELDGVRRHALTDQLKRYQTFITTTDADIVLKNFAAKAQIIPVNGDRR